MESDPALPSTEDVIRKTEQITKNIQELLRAAQENKHDRSATSGSKVSSSVSSLAAPGLFRADGHRSALCSSACVAHCFSITVCCLHPWPSLFSAAMTRPCVTVSLPLPPPHPASPPMEQTMWAKRRCASSQAQPRMFQHAGALGREGPPSPAATRPPAPWPRLLVLWPLSLPPRHSFLFLSVTKRSDSPAWPFSSSANWCAVF